MGEILNLANLRSYASARYSDDLPNWPLGDMLHVKVPVLAYRDYANDYANREWPFCWQNKRHIIAALRMAVTMLMSWQATRRKGGADLILKQLEPHFPRIIRRLQKVLRTNSTQWFDAVSPNSEAYTQIVYHMAKAVGEIAEIVKTQSSKNPSINPMLGSKILSFFFPDFFPIWDTAWISKALVTPLRDPGEGAVGAKMAGTLSSNAARQYARYVNLMITDAWDTTESEYTQLRAECFRLCARGGYDEAKQVLGQFYVDVLPVLFEACLLGRAAREGEL
jgi:hypothetical protein